MAVRWAVSNGNWSATATWDGGTLPGVDDDVYADGKNVTVDISAQCLSVRTQQRSGGTAGGGFALSNGAVLSADAIAGTTTGVTLTSGSATLAGNCYGGHSIFSYGASNTGPGLLTVTGSAYGGSGSNSNGVYNGGVGFVDVYGGAYGGTGAYSQGIRNFGVGTASSLSATGGSGSYSQGVVNESVGSLSVATSAYGGVGGSSHGAMNAGLGQVTAGLDVTGSDVATAYGAHNAGGVMIISGDAIAGKAAYSHGAYSSTTGTLTVNGRAIGNDKGSPTNPYNEAFGVYNQGSVANWLTAKNVTVGGIEFGQYGQSPVFGRIHFTNPAPAGALGFTSNQLPIPIGAADPSTFDFPDESDVRLGTDFASGILTGTLAVPPPSTVLVGVPTDATVGTLIQEIDLSELATAVAAIEASTIALDTSVATIDSTSDDLAVAITSLDSSVTVIEASTVSLESSITALDTSVSTMDGISGDLTVAVAAIGASTTSLDETAASLEESVAALDEMLSVLEPILPDIPVIVVPAPTQPTSTTVWCHCWDAKGAPQAGVEIYIRVLRGGMVGNAYTQAIAIGVSDDTGLMSVEIPRDATMRFSASRGEDGQPVEFAGTALPTKQLPSVLGVP